ncbi:Hypothetical Protein FCC1311_041722 [Hondaea fermentalgiana]|uniref:Uncharacterized protein n=1 Tax=Hondaea fermentalgiana TaxID=2315210 RepID=A0A2R5GC93_9STRA|nr:Hypothetical Protein FCC1311_041722 [Hondaea fermentalgiana]|eukprot:GBG27949.1 Hypothetical Protein FCC1311_041722 [Hondaea fermentalgiana]
MSANHVFKNAGSGLMKAASTEGGKSFMVVGGVAGMLLGIECWLSLSEDYLKTESTYARRYIGRIRKYHLEQQAEHGGH